MIKVKRIIQTTKRNHREKDEYGDMHENAHN